MLTKYDEFLCHQIVSTFDHVETSAREWTERIWFCAHDTKGDFILVVGFGYYPNRNVIDAFVCLAVEGKTQHVVRASRELRPRIDEVTVGPFSWEVIEPMKRVKAALADNEYGVSYDILFDGTMPPTEEGQFYRSRGRVVENIDRYWQVGKPSGWIKVGGQTHKIDPGSWRTERDHSWGIRRGALDYQETGVQPGDIPVGFFYSGASMQFDDWGAMYHVRQNWDGEVTSFSGGIFYPFGSGKEELRLASVDHDFTFRTDIPGTRQASGGSVTLNAVDGLTRKVSIRPLGVIYIGTGGYSYANYRGFTHGLWMGPSWMDGFTLDISNPEVIREITQLDELICQVECDGQVGYGMVEVMLIGKYPKYGYQGY